MDLNTFTCTGLHRFYGGSDSTVQSFLHLAVGDFIGRVLKRRDNSRVVNEPVIVSWGTGFKMMIGYS
jgi:hypothetical protein